MNFEGFSALSTDKRRVHPIDLAYAIIWYDQVLLAVTEIGSAAAFKDERKFWNYRAGKTAPTDDTVAEAEQLAPGTAPFYRTPVRDLLKGEFPAAEALTAKLEVAAQQTAPLTLIEFERAVCAAGFAAKQEDPVSLAREIIVLRGYAKRLGKIPEFARAHEMLSCALIEQIARWEQEALRQAQDYRDNVAQILGLTRTDVIDINPVHASSPLPSTEPPGEFSWPELRSNAATCVHFMLVVFNGFIGLISPSWSALGATGFAVFLNLACIINSRWRGLRLTWSSSNNRT